MVLVRHANAECDGTDRQAVGIGEDRLLDALAVVQRPAFGAEVGEKKVIVNQKTEPAIDRLFVSLGEFDFSSDSPAAVTISNQDTDGYVIIDAVQWIEK